jgi:hypothetical protein
MRVGDGPADKSKVNALNEPKLKRATVVVAAMAG